MTIKPEYRGELAEAVRLKMGYTQKQMAEYFGMTLNSWQKKEQNETRVSVAEYHYFLLLTNEHPCYQLLPRPTSGDNPGEIATKAAVELANYLATDIPLPSKVWELEATLREALERFETDWMSDINQTVGSRLPKAEDSAEELSEKLKAAEQEIQDLKRQLSQAKRDQI